VCPDLSHITHDYALSFSPHQSLFNTSYQRLSLRAKALAVQHMMHQYMQILSQIPHNAFQDTVRTQTV